MRLSSISPASIRSTSRSCDETPQLEQQHQRSGGSEQGFRDRASATAGPRTCAGCRSRCRGPCRARWCGCDACRCGMAPLVARGRPCPTRTRLRVERRVLHPVVLAVHHVVADLHVVEDLRQRQGGDATQPGRRQEAGEQHPPTGQLEPALGADHPPDVLGISSCRGRPSPGCGARRARGRGPRAALSVRFGCLVGIVSCPPPDVDLECHVGDGHGNAELDVLVLLARRPPGEDVADGAGGLAARARVQMPMRHPNSGVSRRPRPARAACRSRSGRSVPLPRKRDVPARGGAGELEARRREALGANALRAAGHACPDGIDQAGRAAGGLDVGATLGSALDRGADHVPPPRAWHVRSVEVGCGEELLELGAIEPVLGGARVVQETRSRPRGPRRTACGASTAPG